MQTTNKSIASNLHSPPISHPTVPSISIPVEHEQQSTVRKQVNEQPEFIAKAAYYENLLTKQAYETTLRAGSVRIASQAYFEEATKTHRVGNVDVGIYAPFVLARSALRTIYKRQIGVLMILGLIIVLALVWKFSLTLTILMATITAFYFVNLVLTLYLSVRVFENTGEIQIRDEVVTRLQDAAWPRYTILCPLYKEAAVVKQFADAMQKLDYPVDKLQIMFLTEADDEGTRDAIRAANLPSYFEILTVPDGQPRTKPRACNYGLLYATGEFVVIFDAEDVPDSLQLKKAVLAFVDNGLDVGCIQAKLNFYNSRQNILTRWFTVEYSTWFDTTLPGLQWAQFALPLGGTSNHFRLSTLRGIGAWDAYNVTEDCDLGLRLASQGYRTLVLDSTTFEEANPNVKNWIRQRSRWIKGYMQTYLIYMRQPFAYLNPFKPRDFMSMQLMVGGRTAVLLINPIMWVMVILYFALRSIPAVVDIYQTLFPGLVLYFAVLCLIFGNLTYIYTHFIGCLKRGEFGLVKWTLLMPIYWALASYAAFKALYQLITKPHYWEKTTHGLHLPSHETASNGTAPVLTHGATPNVQVAIADINKLSIVEAVEFSSNHAVIGASAKPWQIQSEREFVDQIQLNAGVNEIEFATIDVNGDQHADMSAHKHNLTIKYNGSSNGHPTGWLINAPISSAHVLNLNQDTSVPIDQRIALLQTIKRAVSLNRWLVLTILVACVSSIVATIHYFQTHELLIYADAASHLGIARLIFDDVKPGLNQLGGVWLPLPHILLMPFAAINYLYRTGLAGACVSMPCYIITSIYVFLSAQRLTKNNVASFIGTLVFILNPNILYIQTTPLTEPLAALTLTAACYYFLAWVQDEKPKYLLLLAFTSFLATLSRYDGWGLFACVLLLIPIITWVKHRKRSLIEAHTIVYFVLASIGILLWFLWCWLILGDPLYFQRSVYSAQFQQLTSMQQGTILYTYHNVYESFRYFLVLSALTVGPALFLTAIAGFVLFIVQKRFSFETLVPFVFLTPLAFYIFSAYSGQIRIALPMLGDDDLYFNVRYGVIALAPTAISIAIVVAAIFRLIQHPIFKKLKLPVTGFQYVMPTACIALIIGQSAMTTQSGVISLQDGQFGMSCLPEQVIIDYLASHYDGGKILVDFYTNYTLYALGPEAGIDYKNLVYQSSEGAWQKALQNPETMVNWIIVDFTYNNDRVVDAIDTSSPLFLSKFKLVAREPHRERYLYRRADLPAPPNNIPMPNTKIATQQCVGY